MFPNWRSKSFLTIFFKSWIDIQYDTIYYKWCNLQINGSFYSIGKFQWYSLEEFPDFIVNMFHASSVHYGPSSIKHYVFQLINNDAINKVLICIFCKKSQWQIKILKTNPIFQTVRFIHINDLYQYDIIQKNNGFLLRKRKRALTIVTSVTRVNLIVYTIHRLFIMGSSQVKCDNLIFMTM